MLKKTFKIIQNILSVLIARDKENYDYLAEVERKAQLEEKPYLEEKSDFLDECSQNERETRVFLSRVLDAQEMRELRRKEELKRKKANCRFSRAKWKRLQKKKLQKELSLYLNLKNQKSY